MKILVIRVGNIGDVLMATPVVRALKTMFPESSIDLVTSPQAFPVVEHNPYLHDIFIYKKYKKISGFIKRHVLAWKVLQRRYDYCFVLEQSSQYKEFADQCTRPPTVKIGFSGEGDGVLDCKNAFSYDHHVIENHLSLLKHASTYQGLDQDVLMDFILPGGNSSLEAQVQGLGRYAIIHPGTTEYLPYRGWIPEHIAQIARFLDAKGFHVVMTGQPVNQALMEEILSFCSGDLRKKITLILDKSFLELCFLIKHADVVVCSDTGILHVARSFQVPLLGLFGPSNPMHTGPIGKGCYQVIRNDFSCGPCNYAPRYRAEDKKDCLDGKPPACMRSISVAQVSRALELLIATSSQCNPSIKLHLGCGLKRLKGWVNIDGVSGCQPDVVHDLTKPLPYADETVDEILAEDLLEHFDKYMRVLVFSDWARVLKLGGRITVQVPNFKKLLLKQKKFQFDDFVDTVFGENLWNAKVYIGHYGNHKWGYSPDSLKDFIGRFGITTLDVQQVGLNIRLQGVKTRHVPAAEIDAMVIHSHNNKFGASTSRVNFLTAKQQIENFLRSDSHET